MLQVKNVWVTEFFVSDELHHKLKVENLDEGWRMRICQLV